MFENDNENAGVTALAASVSVCERFDTNFHGMYQEFTLINKFSTTDAPNLMNLIKKWVHVCQNLLGN